MTFRRAALIVAVSLTTVWAPLTVGAQTEDGVLKELDRAIQDASVSGDAALLERHLADDFAFTHFGGNRDDKAHWVGLARRNPRPYLRRAVSEQLVEAHGDVALVLGRLDVQTPPRGGQADARPSCYALRYLHAYARREGRWMFLSHHTTAMIEDAQTCR
jgi:ketosteroid isomerase-like protein